MRELGWRADSPTNAPPSTGSSDLMGSQGVKQHAFDLPLVQTQASKAGP